MTQSSAWKILLIDDDEDEYVITRDLLSKSQGHTVELSWVSTYMEGLKRLSNSHCFDAVLIDYDLGAKTGLDLVREINPKQCRYPIILLTGRGSYEVDVEAMQAGVSLYLTKDEINPLLLERGIRYAIEMKRNELILQNRNARLQLLSDLSSQLLRTYNPVELLDQISKRLTQLIEVDVFVHYQRSEDNTHLVLAAIGGYPEEVRTQLKHLEYGQAVCGTVAKSGRPMIVQNVQESKDPLTTLIRHLGITSYACHPLLINGQLFGTLSFGSRTRSYLDPEAVDLLRTVCDLMAVAFERREKELVKHNRTAQKWLQSSRGIINNEL